MEQKEFWSARWENNETQWDAGSPTTPLAEYITSLEDHSLRILIPGCGSGYEAELLWLRGFRNVFVIDIVEKPLARFRERNPDFPAEQLICGDFFALDSAFDLVLEQTFYCAIPPEMRDQYVKKMSELIVPGGKLAGLLFNFPLTEEGPPFGGSEEEYRNRFAAYFEVTVLTPALNSIKPRLGREFWFEFTRKA
jgi:SAM-dependent methyltransferase